MTRNAMWPVAGAALLAACGGAGADDADLVERVDSAGVEIVRNRAPERPLEWRFERVATLGGVDEGPQAFGALSAPLVATDEAGRIYVGDFQNHRVRVFDDAGTQLREVGSRGGGPGEFEFGASLAVGPDGDVRIFDFTKRAIVAFGPAGEVLPEIPMDGFPQQRLRFAGEGMALSLVLVGDVESDSTRIELRAYEASDTTAFARVSDPLGAGLTQLPDCPIGLRIPPLLAPSLEWDAHGRLLAVTNDIHYAIDVWQRDDPGGWTRFRRVTRELPPLQATVEIAALEYPDSFKIRGGNVSCSIGPIEIAEALGFAEFAPHVSELAMAPDGSLWIRHRTGDEDGLRTDVFAPDGGYRGTLPADAPFPAAFRGTDEIVTVEKDEFDRSLVVVWRIVRT